MADYHRLLSRQLRRHLPDLEAVPEGWGELLAAVDDAYRQNDVDRQMLERSLDLSSQELLQANSEMRAIFRATPDLFFRLDGDGTVLGCKGRGADDPLHPAAELVGRPLQGLPPEAGGQGIAEALERVHSDRSMVRVEYALENGERRCVYEARLLPLLDGEIIAIVRNITEQREVEQARERLISELEVRNAEMERFTYTLSHDLKTPVFTIRGFVGMMKRDVAGDRRDRLLTDLAKIERSAMQLATLLEDLLELSQIGRVVGALQEVFLSDLADEAAKMVDGAITAQGVRLEIDDDLPAVFGDRGRLLEVFHHLIGNAVKFMGSQSEPVIRIYVRASPSRPASEALASETAGAVAEIVCCVADNGIGIDPRYHDRVFGLFDRLDPAASDGTGIGLAIVKRVIELHGGRIWIESEGVGQGSTVCFTLPQGIRGVGR